MIKLKDKENHNGGSNLERRSIRTNNKQRNTTTTKQPRTRKIHYR